MSDLNVNVNVRIGLSPELYDLINNHLINKGYGDIMHGITEDAKRCVDESAAAESIKPIKRPKHEKPNPVKGFADGIETAESAPKDEAKEEPEPESEKTESIKAPDVSDIRAAMHRTRCRIEGEDYKENPEGEGRKKYHKLLTAAFTNLSALLGADKPSMLEEDKRQAFIDKCEEITVDAGGELVTSKAPY